MLLYARTTWRSSVQQINGSMTRYGVCFICVWIPYKPHQRNRWSASMCAALPFKLSSRSAHRAPSRKACVSSSDTFCSDKSLFNLTWPVEMYRRTRRHRRSASWISGCLDRFNARQIEHIFPKAAHHGARHRARQPIPTRSQGEEKLSVELWARERIVISSCALHCRCLIGLYL